MPGVAVMEGVQLCLTLGGLNEGLLSNPQLDHLDYLASINSLQECTEVTRPQYK